MRQLNYLFFAILALFTTIIDIAFFSFLPIFGSPLLLTFIILIVLGALSLRSHSVAFASFAILFYAGLSSLELQYILILFLAIPFMVTLLRRRFIFELNLYSFGFLMSASCLIFELLLIIFELNFSQAGFLGLLSFTIINTLGGIIVFFLAKKFGANLKILRS